MSEEQAHPKPNNLLPVLATAINGNELAHGPFEDCKVAIWDYSNPEHFNSLWKSLEDGSVQNASRVLIVWTKTPTDELLVPVNTVDNVSPLHWAVCAVKQCSFAEESANQSHKELSHPLTADQKPKLQICILDLNPNAHRPQYLYQHYLDCDKKSLRWLTVIQAADFFGKEDESGKFHPDGDAVVDLATLEARIFPQSSNLKKRAVHSESFCKRIREELTSPSSPDDRHALANIVGPIVLLNGRAINNGFEGESCYLQAGLPKPWPPPKASAPGTNLRPPDKDEAQANHRLALATNFRATNLLPSLDGKDKEAKQRNTEWEEAEKKAKAEIVATLASLPPHVKLRVTLVDDQWHHGWYEWLKSIFPPETVFTVCPDPYFLLSKLDTIKTRGADLRFALDMTPPEAKTTGQFADVLVLDLRLFSGDAVTEADFYKKLLPLCRKFEVSDLGSLISLENLTSTDAFPRIMNLAWPGFSTAELADVEAWIAGGSGRSDANHRVCLTLLARLFALADMSLPMILFSSTTQTGITEAFKPFSSVITSFSKPALFGSAPGKGVGTLSASTFAYAFGRALKWLQFRYVCLWRNEFSRTSVVMQQSGESPRHFEVYFDESMSSRTNGFRLGALVVGYANHAHAQAVAERMQERGISWFGQEGTFCCENLDKYLEPCELMELGRKFQAEMQDLWVLPVVLYASPHSGQTAWDLLCDDALIQSLVGESLELTLFLFMPRDKDVTAIIYGARRRVAVTEEVNCNSPLTSIPMGKNGKEVSSLSLTITEFKALFGALPTAFSQALEERVLKRGLTEDETMVQVENHGGNWTGALKYVSIGRAQDYQGILSRTFQTRPWNSQWSRLASSCFVRWAELNHPENADVERGARPVHIVSDYFPRDTSWDEASGFHLNASVGFFPNNGSPKPVIVAEGAELSRLLAVARGIDSDDYALAISHAVRLNESFRNSAYFLYQCVGSLFNATRSLFSGMDLFRALKLGDILDEMPRERNCKVPSRWMSDRHQHWTEYSTWREEGAALLEKMRSGRIAVIFHGCRPLTEVERNVGEWTLRKAVKCAYPNEEITSIEWRLDPKGSEFGLVSLRNTQSIPAFRCSYQQIFVKGEAGLKYRTIRLSLGPVNSGFFCLNAEGTAEWRTDVPSCSLVDDGYTKEQIEATMLQACAQNLSNELITRFGLANIITERSRVSKHESTCLLPVAKVSTLAEPIRKYFRPCPNQFNASGKFRSSPGMQHAVKQGSSPSSTPLVRETVADRRPTSEQKAASPSRTNITAIAASTPSTRAAHAADETPTDPCWIKIENIKSKDYFRMTIRKRIGGICNVPIETIRLPDEPSGSAVAFVKLSSAENSQNVAELIREMKWGWNCTRCG